jgi:hypothetical protein
MSGMKIHGSEYTVNKMFSDEFAFEIPQFQRPYAWTTEETGALLDDLLHAVGDDDSIDADDIAPYFLGCVVLIKQENHPKSEVVDGQQRLTTVTILLSALRSTLADLALATELSQYIYTSGQKTKGTRDHHRLRVRERDRAFFEKYIQKPDGFGELHTLDVKQVDGDSKRRMLTNARYLATRLQSLPEMRRQQLALFLLKRCVMVVVSSPDLDSAFRIFSVLNDRGLNLSATDILKAEIIGGIGPQSGTYADKWESIEDSLGTASFLELFSHIRMIYRRDVISSLLGEFRSHILPKHSPQDFVDNVLVPYADAYSHILQASYESTMYADKINSYLNWLNRIDNFDWTPPAIVAIEKYRNRSSDLLRFLCDLERLAAVHLIIRTSRTQRVDRYARLLAEMAENANLFRASSPLQLTQDEIELAIEKLDGPIYEAAPAVPRYVLTRLDGELADTGVQYDGATLSIEHVLPVNPESNSEWRKNFSLSDQTEWVHKIANLVILSRRKNSSARNFDFDKKKSTYFLSGTKTVTFALTSQVLSHSEWTPRLLIKRQSELLAVLKKLWRLD